MVLPRHCSAIFLAVILSCNFIFVGSQQSLTPEQAQELLAKYGYSNDNEKLKGSNPFGSGGGSDQDWIRAFQAVNNLEVTGTLTDDTIAYLTADRCGNWDIESPDDVPESVSKRRRRKKRSPRYKRWSRAGLNWNRNSFNYFVNYPSSGEDNLDTNEIRSEFRTAFDKWEDVAKLEFTEVMTPEEADIQVSFETEDHGDGYPFDGKGRTLAHAFYPRDGRVHFDTGEDWTEYGWRLGSTDLMQVATHEFGHVLGLAHSNVPQNVMNAYYSYQFRFGLGEDDKQGIRVLYGDAVGGSTRLGIATPFVITGVILTMANL